MKLFFLFSLFLVFFVALAVDNQTHPIVRNVAPIQQALGFKNNVKTSLEEDEVKETDPDDYKIREVIEAIKEKIALLKAKAAEIRDQLKDAVGEKKEVIKTKLAEIQQELKSALEELKDALKEIFNGKS